MNDPTHTPRYVLTAQAISRGGYQSICIGSVGVAFCSPCVVHTGPLLAAANNDQYDNGPELA